MQIKTQAEQVAGHLREELGKGRWTGMMPGRAKLVTALGVSGKLVEAALGILEAEGLLAAQGPRQRRLIRVPRGGLKTPGLRIGLLVTDRPFLNEDYLIHIRHGLEDMRHTLLDAKQSFRECKFDLGRIARMAGAMKAEAWIVVAGSYPVLEWFAGRREPVFAMFGPRSGLPIAGGGPDKSRVVGKIVRRLVELRHNRIVLMSRTARRLPEPGVYELAYLAALRENGITPSAYHMPDWEDTMEGFHTRMEQLFRVTPPTALMLEEPLFYVATLHFLAARGIRVPHDLSLICMDDDETFGWCRPTVSHIGWEQAPLVKYTLDWAKNISRGKPDIRQFSAPTNYHEGGSVGPAKVR